MNARSVQVVDFNPLDLALYAADEARRQLGLPGADIHLYLECDGRVDVTGLRRAVAAMHQMYPITAAHLETSRLTGRPTWRLPPGLRSELLEDVVAECAIEPEHAVLAQCEQILSTRIEWRRLDPPPTTGRACPTHRSNPPLRFYVLRGPREDIVIMRWPHFLMDARGGATLLEKIAALYEQRIDAADVQSVGDERRREFGQLELTRGLRGQLRLARRVAGGDRQGERPLQVRRLCPPADPLKPGPLRLAIRRLDREQSALVRDAAMRTCGFARFADFIRAAGMCAAHETLGAGQVAGVSLGAAGADGPDDAGPGDRMSVECYSTLHLVDNRRRRDPGPVCHNVFSALPMHVPVSIAHDIRRVADSIRDQAAAAVESGAMAVQLAKLQLLARLPPRLLAARIRRNMLRGGASPLGAGYAPSLPLGFMGPLTARTPRFCGAPLRNLLGARTPSPAAGFGVTVNTAQDRMNIVLVHYTESISESAAASFLDTFVHHLLA